MRKKLARALRRLAVRCDRAPDYPIPDLRLEAVNRQTDAIREIPDALKKSAARPGIPDAVNTIAIRYLGPQISRSVRDSRGIGVQDTEILDVLIERLDDGWL